MTESDLRAARTEVEERIESKSRRRNVGLAAAAALVVVAGGITATQVLGDDEQSAPPAGPPQEEVDPDADYLVGTAPTAELLTGIWRLDNGNTNLRFAADGTAQFDDEGRLFSEPATAGRYEIDGETITVTTTAAVSSDCIGESFTMRASLAKPGLLRFVSESDPCAPVPDGHQALEQVLPTPLNMIEFVAEVGRTRGWKPLRDATFLHGVLLREGGGHVVEIAPGGHYYVAEESGEVVDQGRWEMAGRNITLTSSADSATCAAGDTLELGPMQRSHGPLDIGRRGSVVQNTCGGAWAAETWIQIPNATMG